MLPQLRLSAYDGGTPPKSDVTTVAITVNRNLFCPAWTQTNGSTVQVLESVDISAQIAQVTATDQDTQVS